jgi:hypothetical protein
VAQLELLDRQLDANATHLHLLGQRVHDQLADRQQMALVDPRYPLQEAGDAGQQLGGTVLLRSRRRHATAADAIRCSALADSMMIGRSGPRLVDAVATAQRRHRSCSCGTF